MASRPPENDDAARGRWMVIQIVRASVAGALEAHGSPGLAALMRTLAP